MDSGYHIVSIRVIWTSWAHVWRLHSLFLGMGYDKELELQEEDEEEHYEGEARHYEDEVVGWWNYLRICILMPIWD
jgi:hypothetical protein